MKGRKRAALIVVVLTLVAAACGNSKGSGGGGNAAGDERTGVTDTEIRVGGVAVGHERPRRRLRRRLRRPPGVLRPGQRRRGRVRPPVEARGQARRQRPGVARQGPGPSARRAGQGVRRPPRVDDHVLRGEVPRRQQDPDLRLEHQPRVEPWVRTCSARRARTSASTARTPGRRTSPSRTASPISACSRTPQCSRRTAPRVGRPRSSRSVDRKPGLNLAFEDTSLSFGFSPGDIAADLDQMKKQRTSISSRRASTVPAARKLGQAFKDNKMDVVQNLPNGYDNNLISQQCRRARG